MTKRYSEVIGTFIKHFGDGQILGAVKDLIINPDDGKVEALWVKSVNQLSGYAVLQVQDIVEWKKQIYVKSERAFADPSEIIKISEILSQKCEVIDNRVQTEEGDFWGRVTDIDFDIEQFYLKKLTVEKKWLGFWSYQKRIISYDLIIEILPEMILVKDESQAKKGLPILNEKQMLLDN